MNNKNVLFISEKQLKEQSVVELNTDPKVLSKVILEVQEVSLRLILGNTLYNQLIDEVYNAKENGTELPAATKVLLNDYVKPYMIYATLVDFLVVNNYKVTNKGLMKLNDANATGVTPSEVEYAKNYYEGRVASRKKALINFLNDNKLLAPEADTNVTSAGIGWNIRTKGVRGTSTGGSKLELNENDPVWASEKANYYTKTEVDQAISSIQLEAADWNTLQNKPSTFPAAPHNHDDRYYTEAEVNALLAGKQNAGNYLTSFTETDPVFRASVAYGITSANINNWNTAYSWGNHALAGYLKTLPIHGHGIAEISGLQTALDGKSNLGHTHTFDSITSGGATKNNVTVYDSAAGNGSAYLTIAGGSGWLGLNSASGITTMYRTDRITVNGSDFMLPTSVTLGNAGTIALVSQIPTNNNQLANGAGYISKAQADTYYAAIGAGGSTYTASNGLTLNGTDLQLGGMLSGDTTINAVGSTLSFYGFKNVMNAWDELESWRGYYDFNGFKAENRIEGWSTDQTYQVGAYKGYAALTAKARTSATIYAEVKVTDAGIEMKGNSKTSGDVEITDLTKGVILKSPDGSRFRVTIDNNGALTSTKL